MGRRKRGQDIHGWVLLDKPYDLTSTQAVSKVRSLFDAKKAGHAGTLDPLATGLLPIALGEATKTVAIAQEGEKTYRFTVRWGEMTDTLDVEGKVVATSAVRPERAAIEAILPKFTGDIEQIPPKFSAIRVNGQRAYDLAREGVAVELAPRPVHIARLDIIDTPGPDETVFEMDCGKGTYVRSLARDMANELGTEGHITQLRRTRVGVFEEDAAISLDELADLAHKGRAFEGLAPVETALDDIPALAITDEEVAHLRQGRSIVLLPRIAQELRAQRRPRDISGMDGSRLVVAMRGETAIALGEAQAGKFQPSRVFSHNV